MRATSFAEIGADEVAVAARQHDVEDDHVEGALGGQPQAIRTVERHIDGEAFGLEPALHRGGDLLVVLHQ